ncbi:MAG: RNA-binding S4 domain-containing protein, partial [Bacteroidales bacterium]|nr:RNA-binding S4 domain-containing protein [Bacteroidales bacterium]
MRVDKYLWEIRLFKTRSEAAEACRLGRVRIGEDIVKA